jgi:iron complex outermembrane receptor protein
MPMKARISNQAARHTMVALLLASSALIAPMTAFAQDAPAQDAPVQDPAAVTPPTADRAAGEAAAQADADAGDIVVTGSRVASSFNAPTPVNVLGSQRLEELGVANIADALNQLPSFREITSPSTNLYRVGTNTSARTLDLRGLGGSRTLVLVNGRRFVPSSELGTVDLNAIPSILIQRAEIVTGGASAAYGADAVAGVVNLILDNKLKGLKTEFSYGQTDAGDGKSYLAAAAWGTDFGGSRGHFVVGGEFADDGAVGDCFTRDWCSRNINLISNPSRGVNGQPANLLVPNVYVILNPGGVIAQGPLRGTQFDPSGNPIPFTFGPIVSGTSMVGGDPSVGRSYLTENSPLRSKVQRKSIFSHLNYEVSDALTVTAEFSYSRVKGGPTQSSDAYDLNRTIQIDNAYLPAATRAAMMAAGVTTIPVSRLSRELGPQQVGTSTNSTTRFLLGVEGGLFGDWKWDAYYQYGVTKGDLTITDNRNAARWSQAIDAVRAPGGQIVCRSTLTAPGNGCVPFNFFGEGNGSAASANWVEGVAWQDRRITQHVAAANVRGTLFNTWAGPVAVATGVEFRRDRSQGDADEVSKASGWFTNYAFALPKGGQDVKEAYVEVSVPLMRDSSFGKSLDLNGAVRVSDYSLSGGATTYKFGAVYRPNSEYMVRATHSRDIRAPSALELSPLANTVNLPINDPVRNTTYFVNISTGGNPDLELEKANTTTVGIVLQPEWLPRASLSVDYYNIKVSGAIDILAGQTTISLCAAGNAALCPFVDRDGAGNITTVRATYQNLSSLAAKGIEIVGNYSVGLDGLLGKNAGDLDFTLNATYVDELSTTDATGFSREFSGWTGNPGTIQNVAGVPKWRLDGVVTYAAPSFSVTAHGRYVGAGVFDPDRIGPDQAGYDPNASNSINYNHVNSRFYLDLSARVSLVKSAGRNVELFGAVTNVLDKDPPFLRLYGNPVLFDNLGRRYRVGLRTQF